MANAHLHVVRVGDTLPLLAEQYQVAEADWVMLNGIQGVHLSPGQKLSVPPAVSYASNQQAAA